MGCASSLALLLLSAGVLSVTVGSQTMLTLEAEPGDNVTIWSQHSVTEPAYIYWFKHTNISVPDLLTCQNYRLFSSTTSCGFIPQSNRMVMSVNSENTSLHIPEVNSTDSGLYYCCIQRMNYIIFSNATLLQVKDRDETLLRDSSRASCSSELLFILTVVFSPVVVILLSALLILTGRRHCRDDAGSTVKVEKEERDGEMVSYAAPQFTNQKVRRSAGQSEATCVVYSSVRH